MPNPATMNAATIMCTVCGGVAGLNIAAHGSTADDPAVDHVEAGRLVIHALAVTTKNALATPAITIGDAGQHVRHAAAAGPRRTGRCRGRSPR